jgi:hypothetical protein
MHFVQPAPVSISWGHKLRSAGGQRDNEPFPLEGILPGSILFEGVVGTVFNIFLFFLKAQNFAGA